MHRGGNQIQKEHSQVYCCNKMVKHSLKQKSMVTFLCGNVCPDLVPHVRLEYLHHLQLQDSMPYLSCNAVALSDEKDEILTTSIVTSSTNIFIKIM